MMRGFSTRFRAKANMSLPEADRRMEAARAGGAQHQRELPPSIIADRLSASVVPSPVTAEQDPKVLSGAPETAGEACTEAVTAGETAISCPGSDTVGEAAPQNLVPAVRSDSRSGPEGGSVNARECPMREPPQRGEAPQAVAVGMTAGRDRQPLRPEVLITITGLPRSGKSVLSHVLISALAAEGIAVTVTDELRPIRWRGRGGALDNLVDRGVSVVLVRREIE